MGLYRGLHRVIWGCILWEVDSSQVPANECMGFHACFFFMEIGFRV